MSNEQQGEALGPCPFCPTERREVHHTQGGTVGVIIHNTGCLFAPQDYDRRQVLTPKGVIAWNTRSRPASAALADEISELFALLTRDNAGRWNFNSLSRDAGKFDSIMERLRAATTSAPAGQPEQKARYETTHPARYTLTHEVHPDIVVMWFLALKSHWFDDPNNMFHGMREQVKAYLYKWVEAGELADDNTTLEIATAMKFREWLSSSWASSPAAASEGEQDDLT